MAMAKVPIYTVELTYLDPSKSKAYSLDYSLLSMSM